MATQISTIPSADRKHDLSEVVLRYEDPDSPPSIKLRKAITEHYKHADPELVDIFAEKGWKDVPPDEEYQHPDAIWLVAYDRHAVPIAICGARLYGEDLWLGRGYIIPEWRSTGLIQELAIARWRWGIPRGAKRSVFGTRRAMHAAVKMGFREGYTEFQATGKEPYWNPYATIWLQKAISFETIDSPKLAEPTKASMDDLAGK